ncbi:peroxidase family protein [Actinocrispum sp. NPDC049592]|uniref:peroxidase family protein n=1 Tax=Actinocrispum sp. NPDC049592 TaxID=3154835 RepID=UPI003447DE78
MRGFRYRALVVVLAVAELAAAGTADAAGAGPWFEVQSLDGSGNNRAHPDWGKAGTGYSRVAPARYADGLGVAVSGPNPRYVSNRVFNDTGQRLSSGRGVTQWAWTWGQFLDHTFGLRAGGPEARNIPFDNADPLERFHNDVGFVPFVRSLPVAGTGVTGPREQVNQLNSYLDAFAVYGSADRLEWMREGPVDGDMTNNGAHLLLPNGMLPRRDERGDPQSSPGMDDATGAMRFGARVAGDIRANENTGLLAVQTLFAREHNRIVDQLPKNLPEETKFQIARRVVIATQQYITYEEFLPALGVRLKPYTGYNPAVNPAISNEFATVGYRGHSMLHGDIRLKGDARQYTPAQLDAIRAKGAQVTVAGSDVEIVIPPAASLFNPDLLDAIQLGTTLRGLGQYAQASNDEQIGDLVRSIPLQAPGCAPNCVTVVFDISAIDIERGRDHGIPGYQQLRQAYGLPARPTFRAVTGEAGEAFPADPELTPGNEINDPDALDFVRLRDERGRILPPGSDDAVTGERRTPLAARLKAIYGDVSTMDAFVGMVSEPKVPGSEFGELQLAIWRKQFEALRDGNRFFYGNDPVLAQIRQAYGVDYRQSLGDLIAHNTGIPRRELADNVFLRCP